MRKSLIRISWMFFAAAAVATVPAFAGTYFESTTETETLEGRQGARDLTMVTHGWVDGANAKIVFAQSDNPVLKEDGYLLTRDGGETLYFVDPAEKTYMEWDMGGMLGNVGALMQSMGGMVEMDFENYESKKLAEEPGEDIQGYSTTYYEYETSYDMVMNVMGMSQRTEIEQQQEIWATTELEAQGFNAWLKKTPPKTGIEGLDEMIAKEMEKAVGGFPLKTVTVQTTTDQRGRTTKSRSTTKVTTIREESIPAGTFELPEGYTETEMPDLSKALSQDQR